VDPIQLVPLCSAVIEVSEAIVLERTPTGTLMVGEIRDSRWEGERFRARQRGRAAADWLDVAPDGTARVDVRVTVETHDGALVYIEYTGRSHLDTGAAFAAPPFRTGDPRYAWLNRVQAIAKGAWDGAAMTMTYPMIYELR
jgi:hypothetical protein